MQIIFKISVLVYLLGANPVFAQAETGNAQKETTSFFVNADCGMCTKRIEAACDLKGVSKFNYDLDTHSLQITFKPKRISLQAIHQAIADAGYDTSLVRATDDAYGALPDCCQYQRIKINN